jgi:integrase
LQGYKPYKIDSIAKVRYLDKEEEKRLKEILQSRDTELKAARERHIKWKKERGYDSLLEITPSAFADYMAPMILVSLNTGLRRGELLNIRWEDVDLERAILTVVGDIAKSGKTRHVPLNAVVFDVLKKWRHQNQCEGYIFLNELTGKKFGNVKSAWKRILALAKIKNFRWHDMRHHFASKLVMAGVDLNTVRELLGHSDIKMTLRYAHLAPEHKARAVEKLVDTEFEQTYV